MRLDKYLSDMGHGTRSELKKTIRSGAVSVGGAVVKDPAFQVEEDRSVCLYGKPVLYESFVYYMLHKPAGIISASEDRREKTVLDLISGPVRKDLFPVGRLDRDTEGLLLITNDGALAHRLLSPNRHVDKVYYAEIAGRVTGEDVRVFREGLRVSDDLICLPADLRILSVHESPASELHAGEDISPGKPGPETDRVISEVEIRIHEGKFHQIKRMFQAVGKEVLYLKRLSMGPLQLDPSLPKGACRRLTDDEVMLLRAL